MQPITDQIKGIDISHWQGEVDWQKVIHDNDNIEFVFIKATEGIGYTDPNLHSYYEGAKSIGLKVGLYSFAHPDNAVEPDAEYFLNAVQGLEVDYPYVIDIEQTKGLEADRISSFVDGWLSNINEKADRNLLKFDTNKYPAGMIYSGEYFTNRYLLPVLAKWPLWVAHYGTVQPGDASGWTKWAVFQYTSSGEVDGIDGNVDMDVMERSFLMSDQTKYDPMPDKSGSIWYGPGYLGLGWYMLHSDGWRLFQKDLGGQK